MKMPEIVVMGGIPEESFPTPAQNTRTTKMLMSSSRSCSQWLRCG